MSDVKDPACAGDYCWRGPLRLLTTNKYAAFSDSFYDGLDRENELLENPDRVSTDGYISLASAIWRFMTPATNGPSPHAIMAGFFVPNSGDIAAKHYDGFGSTIVALSSADCQWSETTASQTRQQNFKDNLDSIGLSSADEENLSCAQAYADFAWSGSSNKIRAFDQDWSNA